MEKNLRKIRLVIFIILLAVGLRFGIEYAYSLLSDVLRISPTVDFLTRAVFLSLLILVWLTVTIRSEYPHHKLPWLLLLAFEPFIGMFLFLSFGRNFKHSRRYRNRPLIQGDATVTRELKPDAFNIALPQRLSRVFKNAHALSHHQPFADNTRASVLANGEAFYPDLLREIRRAKHFILFQSFIIQSDRRGHEIIDALIEQADAGIDVKLIYDALGSALMSTRMRRNIRRSNIDAVRNDPIGFPFFNTRINYRNHRKIIVIDGNIGYTGGMNIGDEYDNTVETGTYVRDTQIKLEGAAVRSLTSIFFKDYYYNTGRFIDEDRYYPDVSTPSENIVQIIQSGPETIEASIRNIYLKMFFTARRSIKIMTPYMALDQETLTGLKVAAQSGIDVEIIIPGVPDKYIVYKVTEFYARVMIEAGIKVYRYDKGFCHAKIVLIDNELASVGTYNLDNRSAVIDFEVSALVADKAIMETLLHQFAEDKSASTRITPEYIRTRPLIARILEGFLSIFTPIL